MTAQRNIEKTFLILQEQVAGSVYAAALADRAGWVWALGVVMTRSFKNQMDGVCSDHNMCVFSL